MYICMSKCVCVFVCVCVCMYVCMYVVSVCMLFHTCTCTQTYTRTHTQEAALVKSNMDLMHIEREKEQFASEASHRKQELESTRRLMDSQLAEERKLRKIISEASSEIARQKKELDQVSLG